MRKPLWKLTEMKMNQKILSNISKHSHYNNSAPELIISRQKGLFTSWRHTTERLAEGL